jgi:hypothetical protein
MSWRRSCAGDWRRASPAQADAALAAYAYIAFPVPVPAARQTVSAGEAFLYLVQFTTLYLAAWHLGSLLFSFVERAFPYPLVGAFGTDRSIRLAMAFIIVALPTFLFTAGRVRRMLAADPARRSSPTRNGSPGSPCSSPWCSSPATSSRWSTWRSAAN